MAVFLRLRGSGQSSFPGISIIVYPNVFTLEHPNEFNKATSWYSGPSDWPMLYKQSLHTAYVSKRTLYYQSVYALGQVSVDVETQGHLESSQGFSLDEKTMLVGCKCSLSIDEELNEL